MKNTYKIRAFSQVFVWKNHNFDSATQNQWFRVFSKRRISLDFRFWLVLLRLKKNPLQRIFEKAFFYDFAEV